MFKVGNRNFQLATSQRIAERKRYRKFLALRAQSLLRMQTEREIWGAITLTSNENYKRSWQKHNYDCAIWQEG